MAFGDRSDAFMQAPHFADVEVTAQLEAIAKSVGSFVERRCLYIGPADAPAWMQLASRRAFPALRGVAKYVAGCSHGGIIDAGERRLGHRAC